MCRLIAFFLLLGALGCNDPADAFFRELQTLSCDWKKAQENPDDRVAFISAKYPYLDQLSRLEDLDMPEDEKQRRLKALEKAVASGDACQEKPPK